MDSLFTPYLFTWRNYQSQHHFEKLPTTNDDDWGDEELDDIRKQSPWADIPPTEAPVPDSAVMIEMDPEDEIDLEKYPIVDEIDKMDEY